jgi:transmembrane sensor
MEKNRFWELLAKVQSGEATPEEQLELNQHLVAFPEDQQLVKLIDAFWAIEMPGKDSPDASETENRWSAFRKKIGSEQPVSHQPVATGKLRRITIRLAGIAAIGLIIAGSIWLWNAMTSSPVQKNIVSTKNGSKSKIEMPDGTQVWLNVGSRIEYDGNYGKDNREITLIGEAYFDVVHNEKKPFIIHTRAMNVKVLGTVFNVKAYPGDGVSEAALIKGSIEVTFPGRPEEKLILRPNDKIAVANKPGKAEETPQKPAVQTRQEKPEIMLAKVNYQPSDSIIIETSWVKNKLIFRSKPFAELTKDMERWFNVNIQVQDNTVLDKKFTGTFSNESITEAMDALSLTYSFQYRFDKSHNTIVIY